MADSPAVSFNAAVLGWHDFYIVAGTAAATLVGLLFVGLSLHLRVVVSRSDVHSLARVTLANFGLVLFVSLFMVVPQGQTASSYPLIISGAFTFAISAPSLVTAGGRQARTLSLRLLVLRFGLSALAYAAVIAAGALLGNGLFKPALSCLLAATVVLLVVSLRNSWDLLVSVGAATIDQQ